MGTVVSIIVGVLVAALVLFTISYNLKKLSKGGGGCCGSGCCGNCSDKHDHDDHHGHDHAHGHKH